MAKSPNNSEDFNSFDYFAEEKKKQPSEVASTEHMITALRADMLPATQTEPTESNIFQRINLKLITGIVIAIVILFLLIYVVSGAGRSHLEKSLLGLINNVSSPTPQSSSLTTITAESSPLINQPLPTSTRITPTRTQGIVSTATPTHPPATKTPEITTTSTQAAEATQTTNCRDAQSITLADVGQILCVKGIVEEFKSTPTYFMVIFKNAKGAFYWVTYDLEWTNGEVNKCYQLEGKIEQLANSPLMLFTYSNLPEECP